MNIHEYQAKNIFRRFGVRVPDGRVAFTKEMAIEAIREIGLPCAVKVQIHAGGRGKSGGIKIVKDFDEAVKAVDDLLGKEIVTYQTGQRGKVVNKLLIEEAVRIKKEYYAGIVLDRQKALPVMMVSPEGGIEIEEIARRNPQSIKKFYALPGYGFQQFQFREMAYFLGLSDSQWKKCVSILTGLYNVYRRSDATLVEVNPLALTEEGELVAIDAKINIDDNALFRHPEYEEMIDESEIDPLELEASRYRLNYIRLDGNVGCMVNGAGLAMATMDIIKYYGGKPANFLDVGGVASAETIAHGFEILVSDRNVKAVLVNIFGGIVRCDRVANGIVSALEKVDVKIPLVVRLQGTNSEIARDILEKSGLNFRVCETLDEAAKLAVSLAKNEVYP